VKAADHHQARGARGQRRGRRGEAQGEGERTAETGRTGRERAGDREGRGGQAGEVRVGLGVGGEQSARVLLEHVGDLLVPGAHVVEAEPHHPTRAVEQRGELGRAAAEGGVAGDRGFVEGDTIDQETTLTDHAALGRERGTDERAREPRALLEQGIELHRDVSAHRGVDLLEGHTRVEAPAEGAGGRVDRLRGRRRRQRAAPGVDREHCAVVRHEQGSRRHADRSRAREQTAGVAGAGQVVGKDRHLEGPRRHECITLP
jgi:hypothetical protein